MTAVLALRGVSKRYGEVPAVDDLSLEIEAGKIFTLLGPSGCGKTTLLRMLAGFDTPDRGCIRLDGQGCVALGWDVAEPLRIMVARSNWSEA